MQKLKNLKHIFAIWVIVMALIFGVMRLFWSEFFVQFTHLITYRDAPFQNFLYTYDWKPSKDIVIIKIDDKSLNVLQAQSSQKNLAIPKKLYAELIKKLHSIGVKGIAFDIVFSNRDPWEDIFARLLEQSKDVVISLAGDQSYSKCITDTVSGEDTLYTTCSGAPRSIYKDANWWMITTVATIDRRKIMEDIIHTEYGEWKDNTAIDTLPLALYKVTGGKYDWPYSTGLLIMNPYFGPPNTYPTMSLSDVLTSSKRDLVANFAGKYIFIWENGTLIHDAVRSPVSGMMMPWVETHAHMLDGFLQKRIPVLMNPETLLLYTLLLGLMMTSVYYLVPRFLSPMIAILIFLFIIWFARYLYGVYGILFDVAPVMLAGGILSFPLTFIYRFFIVERQKRELQKNFSHYVDPVVVKKIAETGTEIRLWGEKKEVTVLFSDIAGFTSISEKLSPTELFTMMTEYLSRMTDILISQWGTLDKYIGDAVMGFFGAPIDIPDHAIRACRTALLMRDALPGFNESLRKQWHEPIDFRVGIASGEVMVGNIGSEDRFNYTVLGDTVNLASRLESVGKEYAVHIIIPEPTRSVLTSEFSVRELDTIAVKGKSEGVRIYELIGTENHMKNLYAYEQYEKALWLYRSANYRDAWILWEKQASIDPPSRVMMERCLAVLRGEIAIIDGVYHMVTK